MPWEFTEHHVRPNVFYWSPTAYNERIEVKTRRQQAQTAYRDAKKASAEGRFADAESLLQLAVAAWPDNDRFSLALADCLFLQRGRPSEALEWYNEILRLKDCPAYRAARSRVLGAQGRLEDALGDIRVAAAGDPENPSFIMSRAMLLERLGLYTQAIADYSAALPLLKAAGQPVFEALFNRGFCYKLLGNIDAALTDTEAAMLQSTGSMTVRTVLGQLHLMKRRYTRALDLFAVVAQHQTASATAANNAALAAYLAVTSDFDDSNATTRAASINTQRRRAALLATTSFGRPRRQSGVGHAGEEGGSRRQSASSIPGDPNLAVRVARARQAAAAAAAAATGPWRGGGAGGALELRGSMRSGPRLLPPLAVLLDEAVAADEGPLKPPQPKHHHHHRPQPHSRNSSRRSSSASRPTSATPKSPSNPDSSTDPASTPPSQHRVSFADAAPSPTATTATSIGPGGPYDMADDESSSDDEALYVNGMTGDPLPTVYLPANSRQWAVDVIRENEVVTVLEPEARGMMEQALRYFDRALVNHRRYLELEEEEEAEEAGGGGKRPRLGGREALDSDTTALAVGEAGDVAGGLLLIVQPDGRVPGSAAVHDREIEDGEIQYNRGLVLLALGRLNEASADLDAAQSANPYHAHYPYCQAVVCARRGRDEEAIAWDTLALQRNPRYFHALYHLGLVLHLRGDHSEAIQRLDAAAALKPRDWRVQEARGRVLQDLDRHTEAVPALKAALSLVRAEGGQPPALAARLHFALAQSAVAAHEPALLKESLRLARLNGQDPASVYNLRGCLARNERQFAAALRHLSRAVAVAPTDPRFYYDRAQCYCDMGAWPEAIDDLTAALALQPNAPLLLFSRGGAQLAFESGDVQTAAEDLERAAERCGGVLRGEGPLWESRKFMSSGSGAPDLSPSLWYLLGCAHARCGRPAPAVSAFKRAAALMPNQPTFLHELAKACQANGDHVAALNYFNRVLALQPRNARALLRRGLTLRALRRYEEAAEDMLAARRLQPGDPLMQMDVRILGNINIVELCSPGEEDDVYMLTKF